MSSTKKKTSHCDLGYWICAGFQHLRAFSLQAENIDEFEATLLAGELALFLNAIRGRSSLDLAEMNRIAKAQRIGVRKLQTSLIPSLERLNSDRVRIIRNGKELWIEEHLDSVTQLYDVVGRVWDSLGPTLIERGAVYILQHTFVMPRTRAEELTLLNGEGFREREAVSSVGVTASFRIVQQFEGRGLDDAVLFNPYVWRTNQEKIAQAIIRLPPREKEAVKTTLELASKWQACPVAAANVGRGMLSTAHAIGLLDIVDVSTRAGDRQQFLFTPHLTTHPNATRLADDLLNDVRAVLACVSYGEHYSAISRLGGVYRDKTINTLRKLLKDGEAGDATAIGVDYGLMEERGIVLAEPTPTPPGGRYKMVLLRREPVEIALRVIEDSVRAAASSPMWVHTKSLDPGSLFATPEQTRVIAAPSLGEQPEEVKEARNYFLKTIRKEAF